MGTIDASNSPFYVSSGVTARGDTIVAGGTMVVLSGANDFENTASGSGANLWVASGGSTSDNLIDDGAEEELGVGFTSSGGGSSFTAGGPSFDVLSTASGSGAVILVGSLAFTTSDMIEGPALGAGSAVEVVFSGGVAIATTISNGGILEAESTGVAISAIDQLQGALLEIVNGGMGSGNIVNNAGAELIETGGIDSMTSVGSAGYVAISAGGEDVSGTLSGDETAEGLGTLTVFSGGSTFATDLEFGGMEVVASGGTAISTIIGYHAQAPLSDGGLILSGASAVAITGASGFFAGGGTASDTIIESTGREGVFSGGLDISASVQSGGTELVFSGGVADSPVVSLGGELDIGIDPNEDFQFVTPPGGGLVNDATIQLDAYEFVWSGGTDSSSTIDSGGSVLVESGGSELNPLFSGGQVTVSAGGTLEFLGSGTAISNTSEYTVFGSGTLAFGSGAVDSSNPTADDVILEVLAGGTALRLDLDPGDQELILAGGVASIGADEGGFITVASDGAASNGIIGGNGFELVESGGTAINPEVNGGFLIVNAGGVVDGTIFLQAGSLDLTPGADVHGITFGSGVGTLEIGGSSAVLSSFMSDLVVGGLAGDTISLPDVQFASGATAVVSGSFLDVQVGGSSYSLGLADANSLSGDQFSVQSAFEGTNITVSGQSAPPTNVWNKIDGGTPVAMTGGDFEGLGSAQLAASETGGGTYIYTPSTETWTKIDGGVPTLLAEGDLYGTQNGNNSNADLAAFYPGAGTYTWQSGVGWTHIDDGAVTAMTTGTFNGGSVADIAASFSGGGVYTWASGTGWTKIDGGSPTMLAAGDIYGASNGNGNNTDLIAYYQGVGTYVWGANTGWTKIDGGAPSEYATGSFLGTAEGNNNQTDLAAFFPGAGTYIWGANVGWLHIDSGNASGLAAIDVNGNGQNELLAYFPNGGMYEWQQGAGWSTDDNTSALPATSQAPEFATGNFLGGPDVLASVGFQNTGGVWLDPPSTLADTANGGASDASPPAGTSTPNGALLGQAIASSFAPSSASSSPTPFNRADLTPDQTAPLTMPRG